MRLHGHLVALGCLLAAGGARAQDTPSVEELSAMNLDDLLGVVYSASKVEETRLKAPASVTVLERDDIARLSVRSVPDLLRSVPGVQVVQTAPGSFVVALRGTAGLNGNNVIVLLDGVPLNNALDAELNWGLFPVSVDSIERIEVVRGPVSTIYGANAYTGVVSIESRHAPGGEQTRARAVAGGGLDGELAPGAEVAADMGTTGRAGSIAVAAMARSDETFAQGSGGVEQPALRSVGLHARAHTTFGEHGFFDAVLGGALEKRAALDYLVIEPLEQSDMTGYGLLTLGVTDTAPWLPRAALWTRARLMTRDADRTANGTFRYRDTSSRDAALGADFDLTLPAHIALSFGGDMSLVSVDAPFIHPDENDELRVSAGGYLRASVDVAERVELGAAMRLDASAFAEDLQPSVRLSAVYYRERYSLRLAAANGFRNPTFIEIAGRIEDEQLGFVVLEGQSGLSLPRVMSVEAGAMVAAGQSATIEAIVYAARSAQLMVADFTDLTRRTYRNGRGSNDLVGAELDLSWALRDDLDWDVRGAFLQFIGEAEDPAQTIGIAEHNARLTAFTGLSFDAIPERLRLDVGALYLSDRQYNLRAGAPSVLLERDVPHLVRLTLGAEGKPLQSWPLWLRLVGMTHAPHAEAESPLPGAAQLGTRVMLLADVRLE
jgi:outer membrane receptor protein involved in Fe transport